MFPQWFKNALRSGLPLLIILALAVSLVAAQSDAGRTLTPGVVTVGTLDAENLAQVYTFSGSAGQPIQLTVTGAADVALLLTDAAGNPLAQAVAEGETLALPDVALPADGLYYVTVLRVGGATTAVSFQLTLALAATGAPGAPTAEATVAVTPEATSAATAEATAPVGGFVPPGELLTSTGLQVALTWNATANLDLEVRDPIGGSLYFDTPTSSSGGQFGVNVNSVCATATAESPTETASWPAGVVPTGNYEVLVYYQPLEDCPTTDPVSVIINATVDGVAIVPFMGTLRPNQVYIASFRVNTDGTVVTGLSGVKVDPPVVQPAALQLTPQPLTFNAPVAGAITSSQPYQAYSFSGQAGDLVSVALNANSGSLDPLLLVVDPNGNQVAFNDDASDGITNSLVANLSLVLSGDYTIIATRYGQDIGGTEGGYDVTLTGAVTEGVVPDFPDLPNGALEVSLQWSTAADIQLLVRDPQGNSIFDDNPRVLATGGQLAADGNVNCLAAVGSPISYIYWPEGRLPNAGPYEVEVWYQNQCNAPNPTASFVLNVVANGQLVQSVTQALQPTERYLTSFLINTDGTMTAGEGGIFGTSQVPDVASLDYLSQVESARVIASGETVTGSIRLNQKFGVYVFDGEAGDVATISLEGLNGTLDPVVFLVDPNGVQAAQNDDANRDTTNSLINEYTLQEDGRYIIIATHFGARFGVTSGDYRLTLRLN
ncbi:MAG TPA: PPC domain-containing protein [Phototrophicaceae bacterium]|nr:PPC domain-containing protein [Phototrophicaceae bacterium]